tara:strand:- start:1585 stop:2190 length:606 start_codon:yes stop_codon:yes gene_type:complete
MMMSLDIHNTDNKAEKDLIKMLEIWHDMLPPYCLHEPMIFLSLCDESLIAPHEAAYEVKLQLPCWVPQRLVSGYSFDTIKAAMSSLNGQSYLWATQFEVIEVSPQIHREIFETKVTDEKVIEDAVRAKVANNSFIKDLLRATLGHPLLFVNRDKVWGFDPVAQEGQNLLAKIWMRVRAELGPVITPPRLIRTHADNLTEED